MSDKENSCQNCSTDPNYAIICSFFEKFAIKCGISHFNFLELQEMLENTMEVRQPLIDLHIKLLRKLRKSCSADKWERVVTRFCHSYSKQDGWELERFGYKNSRIEVKLRLLKHLLEAQFDSNPKFKSEVNKLSASDLRIEPLGRDQSGQTYWCQFDPSCNIRIYKEDVDEESWDLIAKDRVGLVNLIDELSSGEGQKELNSILNDDSNSQEIEKPITDTGQISSGTSPPELTGDESLSQDVKQYSDSTNGSTELNVNKTEPVGDIESDSKAVQRSDPISNEPLTPKNEPSKSEPKCNSSETNSNTAVSNKPVDSNVSKPIDSTVNGPKDIPVHKQSDSVTDKLSNSTFDKPSNIDNSGKNIVVTPTNSIDDKSSKNIANNPTNSIDKPSKNIIDKPTNSIDKSSKRIVDKPTSSIDDKSSKNVDKPTSSIDDKSINNVDKPTSSIDKSSKNVDKPCNIFDKSKKHIAEKPSNIIDKLSKNIVDKPSISIHKSNNSSIDKPSDCTISKPSNVILNKPSNSVVITTVNSVSKPNPTVRKPIDTVVVKDLQSLKEQRPSVQLSEISLKKKIVDNEGSFSVSKEPVTSSKEQPLSITLKKFSDGALDISKKRSVEISLVKSRVPSMDAVQDVSFKEVKQSEAIKPAGFKEIIKNNAISLQLVSKDKASIVKAPFSDSSKHLDISAKKLTIEPKIPEALKTVGREVTFTKKTKGPPGSKLDEIFKFKRVHDPTTMTNLPPQSQPIPAYISPTVKKDSLVHMKGILGDESKELKIPIPGRAAERMPSRLEERLGEISQRLGLKSKQVEIKPVRNTVVDSDQAEDLTKPKPKDPDVTEPESKKPRLNEEPKFSDAVEEPLMLVRGEGSGADCNTANPRVEFSVLQSSINDNLEQTEFSDAIEEPLMYFWGEGSGVDCDTGNPELENETKETDSTTANDEEKETDESPSENNQDKKVHKLWSIDTICNKEKNDNCVGSTNDQFFFGPGCLKDIDKSGTSSPTSDGSKKKNSLDKTNCDNKSNDKNSEPVKEATNVKESEELNLNNKEPNENYTNNSENSVKQNDKSDLTSDENSIPKPVNEVTNDDVASDEVKKEEDKTDISKQNEKSVSDKASNEVISSNVIKPELKLNLVKTNNKLTNDQKSQAEKVKCAEKAYDEVKNVNILSEDCSPEKPNDKAAPSDSTNGISDAKEDTTEEIEQEKTDSKMPVNENLQETDDCKTEEKHGIKKEDIEQNEQSDKLESDPVKEEIKEEGNDKSDTIGNEDETEPNKNSGDDAIDKSEVKEDEAKSDEDEKEETDKNAGSKSKSKAKKNNKKRVRRSSGSGVSRPRPDPVLEPKGSQGEAEILEYRRPRRSAALIATQLSESIIKPKVKKLPPSKKEEKKEENNKDKAKETEPETKPVKKQPAKAKGKKPPAKPKKKSNAEVNDIKKPDQQDENGTNEKDQNPETNDNKDDEASKGVGLNSFSFDVDASGNIPVQAALTALSRKRRLNSSGKGGNSDDEEVDEEEDEDEPLASKKQKLRAKVATKKKSAKGGKQNKKMKVNEEAESSSGEENEENGTLKATKKKPPAKKQPPSHKDDAGKPKPKRGSLNLLGLTPHDLMGVENVEVNSATGRSIRTSRRIAQIKIKEQEEERKLVEESMKELNEKKKPSSKKKKSGDKEEKKSSKKKSSAKVSDGDFTPYDQDSNDTLKKKKGKGSKKKKKALNFDTNNPWKSSSGSGTSEEDNDELEHYDIEEEEEEDLRSKKLESDHEFSPESDLEKDDDEGIPVRHARTALKGEAKVEEVDDTSCQKCSKTDHPEWILLCDKCDKGWHGSCLRPALMIVPEGDWFCPPCQHLSLVEKLKETLRIFERDSKRRENDELRRKRLAYVGISLSNLLPPPGTKVRLDDSSSSGSEGSDRSGSRSGSQSRSSSGSSSYEDEPVYQLRVRSKTNQSYRFNDYDQLINSAIQEDIDDPGVAGNHGRGKDIGNIIDAEKDETNGVYERDEEEEGGEGWKPRVVPRKSFHHGKKKSRKLTSIDDVSSDDQDSDEDFKGSSSSSSSEYSGSGSSSGRAPVRRSTRTRTSRVDKDFINDNSDDSEAPRKKKSRKVWTESETESDETWGQKKKAKGKARNQRRKKSRYSDDSESDRPRKSKSKKSKVRYGLSEDEDYGRKTRGTRKKVNYQESDSDEQVQQQETSPKVVKTRRVIDSDDEDDYKPEPLDERKRAILSDSEDEMSDEDEDPEKEGSVKEEAEVEEKVEDKQKDSAPNSDSPPVIEDVKQAVEEPISPSVSDDNKSQDSEPPEPRRPTSFDNKESDVEMFMGDVEEEDEEELEEEEEDEDEDDDGLKIDIPPVSNVVEPKQPTLPPISVKPTVTLQLQSVKDKIVQEELNDELCSVPGPPKVVPVPVPASEIKDKELDKTEDKVEEKKPVEQQPKVNSIRIVPQHKLMANPPPQLEIKPMLMRPRVPVPPGHPPPPGGMPGPYPGMRYPARPGVNIMRHGAQYPHGGPDQGKYFAPQYPPYYPQQHHFPSEDFPPTGGPPGSGFGPSPHPGSSVYPGQGGEEGGEFGGLVSYFSSQHEDNLDS